ncbi:hypothetical protein [Burkholderia cenocepacia]|uniref:hypothetical protein n=1 Tax=Burkholderia cenocepacia TaxID=95486 RepID=UPI0011158431|nr:hypothetical protein [Burkholderia cenocepacia]
MKTIRDFIDLEIARFDMSMEESFLEDTSKQIFDGNYIDEDHKESLLELKKEHIAKILKIKTDCSNAIDAYVTYFNQKMKGSEWGIDRMSYRECGHPRSLLTINLPVGFANRNSMIFSLDQNGISGLATPTDLLLIDDTIEQCKERIFHDKLVVDMNKKEAPTGTRRQKI